MNVVILGGIGTTVRNVKSTISVYKKLGMTVSFHEAIGVCGNHLYRPSKIADRSVKIMNDIEKYDNYILHCISGSNWLGYKIHSKLPAKAIVLESSPIIPSENSFQNFARVNLGIHIPARILRVGMKVMGVPTDDNIDFHTWYKKNKPSKNVLILTGEDDKLLDHEYIEQEYISEKSNNKLITFQNSGHCNIAKHNHTLYQSTLENWVMSVAK